MPELINDTIERLFDEYETCLLHEKEAVKNEEYEYAKMYKDDASYILEIIKRKPLIEKLEFVVELGFRKGLAEKINDEDAITRLGEYINLFWKEII